MLLQIYWIMSLSGFFSQFECIELIPRHLSNETVKNDKLDQIWTPSQQIETFIESRSINNNGFRIVQNKEFADRFVPKSSFAQRIPSRLNNQKPSIISSNQQFPYHSIPDTISASSNRYHNNFKKNPSFPNALGFRTVNSHSQLDERNPQQKQPLKVYTFDYQGTTSLQSPFHFPKKVAGRENQNHNHRQHKPNWFTEDIKNLKLTASQRPFRASQPFPLKDDSTFDIDSYLPEYTSSSSSSSTEKNRFSSDKIKLSPKYPSTYTNLLTDSLLTQPQQTFKFDFNNAITSNSYANVEYSGKVKDFFTTTTLSPYSSWKSTLKFKEKKLSIATASSPKTTATPTISQSNTKITTFQPNSYVTKIPFDGLEKLSYNKDDSDVSFSHNLKTFLSKPEDIVKPKLTFIDYAKMYFNEKDKMKQKKTEDTNATLSYSFNLQDYLKAQNIYENNNDNNEQLNLNENSNDDSDEMISKYQVNGPTTVTKNKSTTIKVLTTKSIPINYVTTNRPLSRQSPTISTTKVTRMFRRKQSTSTDTCEMACLRNIINQEYNPVCGSDNRTYTNKGKFRCASICGQQIGLKIQHVGICVPSMANNTTLII